MKAINIYIVAGLGGGTGSGLWLDTAYCRKILADMGINRFKSGRRLWLCCPKPTRI